MPWALAASSTASSTGPPVLVVMEVRGLYASITMPAIMRTCNKHKRHVHGKKAQAEPRTAEQGLRSEHCLDSGMASLRTHHGVHRTRTALAAAGKGGPPPGSLQAAGSMHRFQHVTSMLRAEGRIRLGYAWACAMPSFPTLMRAKPSRACRSDTR